MMVFQGVDSSIASTLCYGTVDEMADACLFLAGEAAGYVNGHILFVDGGYMASGVAEVAQD